MPFINSSFILSLDSLLSRFLPGLETLNKWIERREADIISLTLKAYLLLNSGVLGLVFVFPVDCNASHGALIFQRGLRLLPCLLDTFTRSTGLRIDLVVDYFRI